MEDERSHSIYKITNTINSKIYIGQSVNPKERFARHKRIAKTKGREFCYLQASIAKHGEENFTIEIIDQCNGQKEANDREIYWIAFYDSTNREKGMNLTKGGGGAAGVSPSEETRKKISKSNTGKKASEETKRKKSEAELGSKNHFYGKHHSKETKKKLSELNKGRLGKRGESCTTSKLKEKDIIEIRKLYSNGESGLTYKDIAKIYNVIPQTIHLIVRYKRWKHVKMPSET